MVVVFVTRCSLCREIGMVFECDHNNKNNLNLSRQ